jgi:aldehyde:ferredoxin oxidoreductase
MVVVCRSRKPFCGASADRRRRILLDEGGATVDPLAPTARLRLPVTVRAPASAKFAVVSKSPLTDRINDSLASSGFAIAGKRCGGDAIAIVGRADELSVLIVDDGAVRFEPADDLRGATCQTTDAALKPDWGRAAGASSIISAIGCWAATRGVTRRPVRGAGTSTGVTSCVAGM